MSRWAFVVAATLVLLMSGVCSADVYIYDEGTYQYGAYVVYKWRGAGTVHFDAYAQDLTNYYSHPTYFPSHNCSHASWIELRDDEFAVLDSITSGYVKDYTCDTNPNPSGVSLSGDMGYDYRLALSTKSTKYLGSVTLCVQCTHNVMDTVVTFSSEDKYTVSGTTSCLDNATLYVHDGSTYQPQNYTTLGSSYSFPIFENHDYMLVFSNGAYYDFTCTGDEVFDYDACIWVYGYTCGIDTIVLRDDESQTVDQTSQESGYDIYEMIIENGEEYTISFYDMGILLCYNQTFTCTGDHVLIDFDRCNWVYPPNGEDIPIYIWAGYDYNIVIFKDNHGNMVESAELAVYDNTDDTYIQKWTGNPEGYALLGAKFDTDHDVLMMLRTFDGVFTLDTTYPANGSATVGEEVITTTNWTIPIKYNLNVLPVDQYGVALFDVFCGLSEYTPLDPGAFWGMDLSDQGYVAVTNCSGFAMCDIIAEKEGYADYKVEALNWTSKSALVKDYRHNVVMEEE